METTTEKTVLQKRMRTGKPSLTDLVFDDGEPLETNRHRIAMNVLSPQKWLDWAAGCLFVGGNMFIYYSTKQARNRDFKGPDFFVVWV